MSALPMLLAIIFGLWKSNSIEYKMEYGIAAYPTRGTWFRVSVHGVKSLGCHFACLCSGVQFYFFKKKMEILLHFLSFL